ncbi:MAG: hypothetical protein RIR79_1283 [Pseudomonadota bacterium]|jgi:integration host factor subunit beta
MTTPRQENPDGVVFLFVPMTRSDLIEAFSLRFPHRTQRDADKAVKHILRAMTETLIGGNRIEIRGFGSFSVSHRTPRMGRNPRSGASVAIPEQRVPHFKPSKALRQSVNASHNS